MQKTIIIASSGTGGHIYPGIAVARELESKGFKPVFFISSNPASLGIIKNEGYEYVAFNLSGMPRKASFSFIVFCVKLFFAFLKSFRYILKLKPQAVFGTGGYISVPVIFAGRILGKKTYLHEQNSVAGIANRFLSLIVSKVFISFESSAKYFKRKNFVLCGYPIRKDILGISKEEACKELGIDKNIFTVLIVGGSLGAAKLNEIAFNAIMSLRESKALAAIQVIHITGNANYTEIKEKAANLVHYNVFPYMHDIKHAYAASDAVISRAGAGAVFELKSLNKPAVLIPYPYATDNHQFYNAKELEGAIVIEEKDLTPQNLCEAVVKLKNTPKTAETKQEAKPLPQETIVKQIIDEGQGEDRV